MKCVINAGMMLTIIWLPPIVHAEVINLTCIHVTTGLAEGTTKNIEIDTDNKTSVVGIEISHDVKLTNNEIVFSTKRSNGYSIYSINRTTGEMAITEPNGNYNTDYICNRANPKF